MQSGYTFEHLLSQINPLTSTHCVPIFLQKPIDSQEWDSIDFTLCNTTQFYSLMGGSSAAVNGLTTLIYFCSNMLYRVDKIGIPLFGGQASEKHGSSPDMIS